MGGVLLVTRIRARRTGLLITCVALAITVPSAAQGDADPGTAAMRNAQDAGVADGAPPTATADPPSLKVGYVGSAPFVRTGPPPAGLSVDVWQRVAKRADSRYEWRSERDIGAALRAVERGELDVAVGPISITSSRAERVRFTQPYFQAHIGILATPRSAGLWKRLAPFLGEVFARASLLLLLSLLGIGTLVWWVERRRNPEQFPPGPARGIGNGMWFALVTMTTVGYGDRAPTTVPGRLISGLWMLVALVTTSSLTAGFASAFTVLQLDTVSIKGAGDLQGQRVAVVRGTTGAVFARAHGARLVEHTDLSAAAEAVVQDRAVAVVHDRPMLRHYLTENPDSPLRLAAPAYDPQGYGFAVAPGHSELLQRLDVALLSAHEDGELARVIETWLGGAGP